MAGCGNSGKVLEPKNMVTKGQSIYDLSIQSLDSTNTIEFANYKGKFLLLVNVASKCGYTPQYEDLQKLYEQFGDTLEIVGFPCNQFMGQEPGSSEEIANFCSLNYGVTFPLTAKIDVKGDRQHDVYQWLTKKELNGVGDFSISWNFNKFLISPDGKLLEHFVSDVKPLDDKITHYLK
ncbi:MAG: glutathione peroxidase [Bacteroidetes bacterium]|nr:glutathione peroxidase [Bacteroidota bacterium]